MFTENLAQRHMKQMRGRVVVHSTPPLVFGYRSIKLAIQFGRERFRKMNDQIIFFFSIQNNNLLICRFNHTSVSDLTAAFSIEGSFVQHQLKEFFIFLFDFAVFYDS